MNPRHFALAIVCMIGCAGDATPARIDQAVVRQRVFGVHDSIAAAMVDGRSTGGWQTAEWRGVNLNGTPMSNEGFEGEERVMRYDSIQILDRDIRVYGETAAVQWHGNFFVNVNGASSFAEMRLLELYVYRDGQWLLDLTQATPVFGTVGNPPQN